MRTAAYIVAGLAAGAFAVLAAAAGLMATIANAAARDREEA